MAKTYNRLNIEINQPINDIMTAVKDDTFSRFLDVFLFSNGTSIDLTDHKVRIYIKKPDGKEIYNQGTITDAPLGRVQFELTNQTLAVCGQLQCQIIIYNNEETQILSTEIFKIMVTQSLICEEAIESTNEYGALVVLFQNIYEALVLIEQVAENTKNCAKETSEYLIENKIKELELSISNIQERIEISSSVNKIYFGMEEEFNAGQEIDSETIVFQKTGKGILQYLFFQIIKISVINPQNPIVNIKFIKDNEIILNLDGYTVLSTGGGAYNSFGFFSNVNGSISAEIYRENYIFLSPSKNRETFRKPVKSDMYPFYVHSEQDIQIFNKTSTLQKMAQLSSGSDTFHRLGCWMIDETPLEFDRNFKVVVTPKENGQIKFSNLYAYYKLTE